MACCMHYRDLAKRYMENAKKRTMESPWDSFLYGLALTMTFHSENHPAVIKALKRAYPTPESARKTCTEMGRPFTPEFHDFTYDENQIHTSVCRNASERPIEERTKSGKGLKVINSSWPAFVHSMETCNRRGIQMHYTFQQEKGPDMMLLESGCPVPVMDVWMLRRVLKATPEQADNLTAFAREIQRRPRDYAIYRKAIIKEAKQCGEPIGEHHVACWFEERALYDKKNAGKTIEEIKKIDEKYFEELITAMKEVSP